MARKTKAQQEAEAAAAAAQFDDFGDYNGGSATRFSREVCDRIVAYIAAKQGGTLSQGFTTPVTLSAEDAADRSTAANTAWDYVEALRAAVQVEDGFKVGSRWVKQQDKTARLAILPRKVKDPA